MDKHPDVQSLRRWIWRLRTDYIKMGTLRWQNREYSMERYEPKKASFNPDADADKLFSSAVHHIHAKLFEQDVKKNNRNDKEPELVPAGEQAALWFSLFGHSL